MCGICGIAYTDADRPVERSRLLRMRRFIDHRGPDGAGDRVTAGAALGHTRLSIIDLDGGAQPLANEDGTVWITFNGEIYNYHELTGRLQQRGHRFRTRSDTEAIVHAYEEYGLDFVHHLNGMFALALHDAARRRVILARDPFGIKPLFYSVTSEGLFFASEIKAVLAGSGAAAAVHPDGLHEYLIFRYTAGERTFFQGVNRLMPGHVAVWEDGSLTTRRYWQLPGPAEPAGGSLAEAAEALDEHLDRAVRLQLMSEVPLGTFCSGGVDSGLVTGYAARHSPHRLRTFSVGFDDPAWDESGLARDTASRYGTDHGVKRALPGEFAGLLPSLVWYNDEPLSHPNSVPLYVLSRFAREHVTVVLTGEGADEVFGGYPRYHIGRLRTAAGVLPAPLTRGLAGAAARIPGHRARRLAELLPLPLEDSLILNSAYVAPATVARLTGAPVAAALSERRALLRLANVPGDAVATLCRYEVLTYLGCALDRMDRMSMACGLEGRVPFLDRPLVEWALTLDSRHKIAGRRNKRVVKRLAAGRLSEGIVGGGKSGFGLPLADWFRGPALAPLVDRLRDPAHPAAVHFQRRELDRLLAEHLRQGFDHGEALWLTANVYLWYEVHAGGEAEALPAPPGTGRAATDDVTPPTGRRSRAQPAKSPT